MSRPKHLSHIAPSLHPLVRPIAALEPDPKNARRRTPRNLAAIRASLAEHGQQKPVVVTKAGVVIAGNGTYQAALDLGWKHLAATTFVGDDAAARKFAVRDNRSAELAEWDDAELASALEFFRAEDAAILEQLGFSDVEFDRLVRLAPREEGLTDPSAEWKGMPEFDQPETDSNKLVVHFRNDADREAFAKLLGQPITSKTRTVWFPRAEIDHTVGVVSYEGSGE